MKKSYKVFVMFCELYAVLTIFSSVFQLCQGRLLDTNLHILLRAVITLLGVGFYTLYDYLKIENHYIRLVALYVISIVTVFFIVWITSFFDKVTPSGYRDIFINWSVIFLVIVLLECYLEKRRNKIQ